jgi:hypothetical protein
MPTEKIEDFFGWEKEKRALHIRRISGFLAVERGSA